MILGFVSHAAAKVSLSVLWKIKTSQNLSPISMIDNKSKNIDDKDN